MKITVKDRQTLEDISVQYCGTLEAVVELAAMNGLSVTAALSDGQILEVPDRAPAARVVERYRVKRIEPATEPSAEEISACPYGGINYMGIEIDFTVS